MAREPRESRGRDRDTEDGLVDKLVTINRVAKVVKGGRRFAFAALVVAGDQKGRVGWGHGKAREVPEAIRKATEKAKRSMIRVPMKEGRTLHHDIIGRFGAGKVVLRSATAGTGIIAGGALRAVFETLGIGDVVAKSLGSRNPHNIVKATFDGLHRCASPRSVATRRGKKVAEIFGRRDAPATDRGSAAAAAPPAGRTEGGASG
jgi:small subunit ribosomal protein S5